MQRILFPVLFCLSLRITRQWLRWWSNCRSCGEEELVRQAHTLFGRSAQVVYESSAGGSGRSSAGSTGSRRGKQGEEKRSHEHEHVDGMKDSLLEPRCVCASHHAFMNNWEHVVIGVRVMHCHHAFVAILSFLPLWVPVSLVTCSQFQLVVRMYELIVTFHCNHFVHTFAPRKHVIWGVVFTEAPQWDIVPRTHRVAPGWLFDRINLDQNMQIRHIDTKNQLEHIPTKWNFTRDGWNIFWKKAVSGPLALPRIPAC